MNNENTEYQLGVLNQRLSRKHGELDELILEVYELSLKIQTLETGGVDTFVQKTENDNNGLTIITHGIVTEKTQRYDFLGKYPNAELHVNILSKKDHKKTKRFCTLERNWEKYTIV